MVSRAYPEGFGPSHNPTEDFVVYLCPDCGYTIRWPNISLSAPNTTCSCSYPDHVTQMVMVWPIKQKIGER